jgi:hypothetical protein
MALVVRPGRGREVSDRAGTCTNGGLPLSATAPRGEAERSAGEVVLMLVSTMLGTAVNFYLLTCWQAGEWLRPVPAYADAWVTMRTWWATR